CRKPKIPENALECHEYIEDENVECLLSLIWDFHIGTEFPTCCARLRCVVEVNGERIVQTRGQPGELFPDKPWKGQQNEPNPAVVGMTGIQQNTVGADGNDINGRRYVDPYPNQPMQESPRKKRSTVYPLFDKTNGRESSSHQLHQVKIHGYSPEKYTSYFTNNNLKSLANPKLQLS
ncbi:hypothetical protein HF086_013640, partial [Spodoptera exigua]